MSNDSGPRRSILAVIQDYASSDAIALQPPHPFSENPDETLTQLKSLIDATVEVSGALNAYSTLPLANGKLFSLFRQNTAITHTVHNADQTVHQTVAALRKRAGTLYGENIPLDRIDVIPWCISRLETWGTDAGIQVFKEEEREGRISMLLGGKVIVIDVELTVDRSNAENPTLSVASVKTSYAIPNGTTGNVAANGATGPTTAGSASLDGFLTESLRAFVVEIQKDLESQDPEKAEQIGRRFTGALKYLERLDQFALHEGEAGLRWFNGVDILSLETERFAGIEAQTVSKDLGSGPAPLDIFLMRGHSLPLPYLTMPSLSFLVYLSPLAYLSMLRHPTTISSIPSNPFLPPIDVPFSNVRSFVGDHPRKAGVTIAELVLISEGPQNPDKSSDLDMDGLSARPTFPLVPSGSGPNMVFPSAPELKGKDAKRARFILDFTDGGKCPGVVMSQSRMREVETIVNPLASLEQINNLPLTTFGSTSWVDLLLNPNSPAPCERYTAIYTSPTALHPPLQLRLTSPDEPGFRLEKVPVRNTKDIWGILEIVREQCWLNEVLLGCQWTPELLNVPANNSPSDDDISDTELQAVLSGNVSPESIPVNVYVPTQPPHDPLFDSDIDSMARNTPHQTTKIVMTSPERPPVSGLVEIVAAYDYTRPRGVSLTINGALGADMKVDVLEEVCRRGGLLGLPGRIWAKTHGLA